MQENLSVSIGEKTGANIFVKVNELFVHVFLFPEHK